MTESNHLLLVDAEPEINLLIEVFTLVIAFRNRLAFRVVDRIENFSPCSMAIYGSSE